MLQALWMHWLLCWRVLEEEAQQTALHPQRVPQQQQQVCQMFRVVWQMCLNQRWQPY
jgi:hypothetical protein